MMMPNEWFYEPDSGTLRLGDIVTGYTSVLACLGADSGPADVHVGELSSIRVVKESLAVVLTPCCSIEGKTLVIGSLEHVRPVWFGNPYLSADFVRIDRKMYSSDAIPPEEWTSMSASERADKMALGPLWSYLEYFAFPSGSILPPYSTTFKSQQYTTDFYVVDFRHPMLVRHEFPQTAGHACGEKVLQLSSQARELLRRKIAYYYFRRPTEDAGAANTVETSSELS
jgi:hypothetical protein